MFAEGRLWLLSDTGHFFSITPGAKGRVAEALAGPVGLCALEGFLHVVTREDDRWALRRRGASGWQTLAQLDDDGDEQWVGLSCTNGGVVLVTSRRLIEWSAGRLFPVVLSKALPPSLVAAVHATHDRLWLGLNQGEWGGGLLSVDRRTGQVQVVEKRDMAEVCAGPLNAECDPVNGIVDSPWHSGCVDAAVGLVHMGLTTGRIVEICPGSIRTVFSRGFRTRPDQSPKSRSAVPFFGLRRVGGVLMAVGLDGVYRWSTEDQVQSTPLPKFANVEGVASTSMIPGSCSCSPASTSASL